MNTEWKPIESAPKDGTEVWAYNGEQARMRWTEGECYALWIWADDLVSDADPCPDQPTHWMPLPAPPCATCNGHGMIGGPSFYAPDEGGEPCPDCSPAPTSHPIPTGATGEDEQSAFERWLERTCPSGDVESVQRQWEASSDYADFHAPAAGDAQNLTLAQKYEDACIAANANARDAERYRWLRDHACNSLHVTRDGDHACNYLTAAQWIESCPEDFQDDGAQEIERMKATNTIWRLQVYPNTPIGFWVLHASTLDAAIDAARAAIAQQKGEA
jgi:hypothetical protein